MHLIASINKSGVSRRFLAALTGCLLLANTSLYAQNGTSSVSGQVSDAATKLTLSGVRVTVVGTHLETYTGTSGDYYLPIMPSGTQSIDFSYVGYPDIIQNVTVTKCTFPWSNE